MGLLIDMEDAWRWDKKYICIYRHNIQCTYATVYRHIKRQTFWWGDHSCPFLVESVSNKVMQVGNYPGFCGMGSRRWWHLPRYSHQKRREDAWKSSIFLFMFFLKWNLACFPGAPPQLILRVFFSACLMKRILESSIFHTTRLLNTSEAKKWQAVSRHSHLWRLRSVVTLLLKLFSGEVKFPGSTKTHGKKGPVWFSKCWSFRTPAPVAFFCDFIPTIYRVLYIPRGFLDFFHEEYVKESRANCQCCKLCRRPGWGDGSFFKWWYRITGMKSYHHCQGFAEICHEMVTSHLFRCYSNFPPKKSW